MTTGSSPASSVTVSGVARTLAMVPEALCSVMALPRTPATRSRVSSSIAPAQCRAEISPRLCPTATSASTPIAASARRPAMEPVTMRGWATAVATMSPVVGRFALT